MKLTHLNLARYCASLVLIIAPLAFLGIPSAAKTVKPKGGAAAPTSQPTDSRLVLTTWAPSGFLKNPTALSFDRDGRCYVAQTQRREGGEMESRSKPSLHLLADHTFRTVEDRARYGGHGNAAWGEETGGKMETITMLQDTNGSGRADKASIYYQGFNRNINDILAGVLWNEGNVYATCAPDLTRLHASQPGGGADDVQSISHGFAVHMGYPGHNMHGLTVGPDGKIYCTMGDKGISLHQPDGKQINYPNTGTVVRMNPDGTNAEAFCTGVRNTFEVAFDKYGNLFSVDNDADYPTERERFVYLTEGSDSGWRFHYQFRSKKNDVQRPKNEQKARYNVWMDEKLWVPYFKGQPAYILPPLSNYSDGPAGFKYASEACLDEGYAGFFFLAQFPKALVTAFRAEPKGAAFVMTDERAVVRGTQCVGLTFGPDGALYGAEWGKSGFKLGNTGSVVKLDDPAAAGSPLRKQTQVLLHEGPYKKTPEELQALLGHADMRVRLDAQFELARRKAADVFINVAFAEPAAGELARIHALWGLGQLVDNRVVDKAAATTIATKLVSQSFKDPSLEVRVAEIKLLGQIVRIHGPVVGDSQVVPMLDDPSPRVRYFAAVTLGKFADAAAVPALLKFAAGNLPVDPYLRLAAAQGLAGCNAPEQLAAATVNPSVQARLAAVVALRRMKDPGVARFLGDKDELVVSEAAHAIHDDDSIPQALPALAALASRPNLTSEPLLRRVLNANLRLGGKEQIANLANFAADDRNPADLRVEAMEMLAQWEDPAVNDRVEGIYRTWPRRSAAEVKPIVGPLIPAILATQDADVSRTAAVLINKLKLEADDGMFVKWVADPARAVGSRTAALSLLASRKYAGLSASIDAALGSTEPLLRAEALRILVEVDPPRATRELARAIASGAIVEKQTAFRLLPTLNGPAAESMLSDALDKLLAGSLAPDVHLDVLESARELKTPALKSRLGRYDASLNKSDPLALFGPCLTGGDPQRGREVFTGHSDFSCISCHSVDGTGSTVGPNLAGIGSKPDKPRRYLLESLIVPSAYIVPGYGIASFTLKDGRTLSGFVRTEDATTIHLTDLEGHASEIAKAEVQTHTPAVSMMPAMGTNLTPEEIRDVVEYLTSLK